MTKWIEAICLRYDEADKEKELYVRLFFQMIGVYVYEQSTEMPETSEIKKTDYFADIIFLSSNSIQYYKEWLGERSDRTICVLLDKRTQNILNEIELSKNVIFCNFSHEKGKFLFNIIQALERIYFVGQIEDKNCTFFDEWLELADLYAKKNIASHMYICEYFTEDVELLEKAQKAYDQFVESVFKKLESMPQDCNYFRYVILYMAYSLNQ